MLLYKLPDQEELKNNKISALRFLRSKELERNKYEMLKIISRARSEALQVSERKQIYSLYLRVARV
jgi:hypothetical protein